MMSAYNGLIAGQMAAQAASAHDASSADSAIEGSVRSMLAASPLARADSIAVAVHGGVVTLEGMVSDGLAFARFKNQVTSALPSVTLDDRVEWVLPDCGIGFA